MKPRQLLLPSLLCLAGCAAPEVFSDPPEGMVRREADLFRHGPAQPGPPVVVPRRTLLRTLSKDSAYSFVKLEDGRTGYIDSSAIAPAPPTAPAVPFDPPEAIPFVEQPLPDFSEVPAALDPS